MTMIMVKPGKDGLKVRNPKTMEFLSAEGARVEMNTYWARRIQSGDVVVVAEKAAASAKKVSKT